VTAPATFATRGTRRIRWESAGRGPAVLLLPGIGSGSRLFGTLPRRFVRDGCRCLTFDPVGIPPSSPHAGAYDFGAAADDVLAVLDAAGVAKACLAGTSLGGRVATVAAARFPERVTGAALLATSIVATPRGRRVHRFFELAATRLHGAEFGEAIAPFLFGRSFQAAHPQAVDDIVRALRLDTGQRELLVAQARVLQSFDPEPFARAVRAPVLCIAGGEDTLTPAADVAASAERFAAGRYLELPSAGHSVLLESAAAFEAVLAFVRATAPAT
jgi:3-oxoadipate enol-lactonase/4-carboxymuconolactone decarboxylase